MPDVPLDLRGALLNVLNGNFKLCAAFTRMLLGQKVKLLDGAWTLEEDDALRNACVVGSGVGAAYALLSRFNERQILQRKIFLELETAPSELARGLTPGQYCRRPALQWTAGMDCLGTEAFTALKAFVAGEGALLPAPSVLPTAPPALPPAPPAVPPALPALPPAPPALPLPLPAQPPPLQALPPPPPSTMPLPSAARLDARIDDSPERDTSTPDGIALALLDIRGSHLFRTSLSTTPNPALVDKRSSYAYATYIFKEVLPAWRIIVHQSADHKSLLTSLDALARQLKSMIEAAVRNYGPVSAADAAAGFGLRRGLAGQGTCKAALPRNKVCTVPSTQDVERDGVWYSCPLGRCAHKNHCKTANCPLHTKRETTDVAEVGPAADSSRRAKRPRPTPGVAEAGPSTGA